MIGTSCVAVLTPLTPGTTKLPDQVLFESRGAVLIFGDDARIADAVTAVSVHHRVAAFAPGIDAIRFGARVTTVGARVSTLHGRLGAFRAEIRGPDGLKDIGAASTNHDGLFDLVLDLGAHPLAEAEVAPIGYFAPGSDPMAGSEAIAAMRILIGSFTKPRYFKYEAQLCAHGASGLKGCVRCLDVCSAKAIASAGDQIRVDPYLCQGCAACTLACPTGALSFTLPTRDSLRERLAERLRDRAPGRSVLVVHGKEDETIALDVAEARGASTLLVDPLVAFGEELWLDAFAQGAAALAIVDGGHLTSDSRALIGSRIAQARVVLQSLGVPAQRLGFVDAAELPAWLDAHEPVAADDAAPDQIAVRPSSPATKRLALLDTVRQLGSLGATATPVAMAPGACFGEVLVNRDRCTLCFACVNLCPTGALSSDSGRGLRLTFSEDACVQCGLCERGCPEKAVSLRPRFQPQAAARGVSRVLNEDAMAACTTCRTPFIGRKLLASSLERIKGHPVLAQGGQELLLLCPECRQRALLEA